MACLKKNLTIVLFLISGICYCYGQTGCTISYKTDLADKEPVLLLPSKFGNNLYEPTTSELKLNKNADIILACPGASNKITGVNKELVSAKCVGGKLINIDGTQKEFNKVSCDKKATGQNLDTAEPCGKRGIKKYLGHKIGDKWYYVLQVCYDQKNGQTLYSKHVLQGASINHDKQTKLEGNFKIGGLEFRVKPEQLYTQANLKKIFTNLLGTEKLANQYINAQSVLVRGQLSPKSDFVLTTSQYASFFYVNTIPQWKVIGSGNWKTLEEAIRKTATALKEDLKIVTGTYEVLELKDKNNKDVKIYLDQTNTLPVPKFVWKIVYSPTSKKAIAFVNINNPFLKTVAANDYLCNDICDKQGWANNLFKDGSKGIIYCCDAKQLVDKIKVVPNIGDITGILDAKTTTVQPKPPTKGCLLNYKTDFPEKQPILLKKNGQKYESSPLNELGVTLNPQEEIMLHCTGASNKITKLNKNFVTAKCVSGSSLKIEGKNYNFKDLGCNQKVNTEYKLTRQECADRGLVKQIGHKYDDNNFVNVLEVCYDHKQGIPVYSQHTVHGKAISTGKLVEQNIEFKVAGLDFKVNAEEDYKLVNQKQLFEKLLESKQLADKYVNDNSYLARAHLSPTADFVFTSARYASYFYINTAPQWQTINNGNWKSLENAIRTTASTIGKPFDIITGTYGVLTMKNAKGKDVELYLDVLKTLPVPKYIYKVMYSPETKKGIAFISYNNPYAESISKNDYICPNVCKNHGWGTADWEKKEKGLIYCCEVKELLKVVDTIDDIGVVQSMQEAKK